MAGFLYYFPDGVKVSDCGFAEGYFAGRRECTHGPDGLAGITRTRRGLAAGAVEPSIGYYRDKQVWRKCAGGWFLGFETAAPPKATDLLRAETLDGYWVPLSNGEKWLVPSIKAIPAFYGLNDAGEREWKKLPGYEVLQHDAEDYLAVFEGHKTETASDAGDIFERVLAVNYAVGKWELDSLQIPTKADIDLVLLCLIDAPDRINADPGEEAKKKE